jgi:hypothetical protein
MAHRTFTDSQGVAWEVWDVIPGRMTVGGRERRFGLDRRVVAAPGFDPDEDRRLRGDRRTSVSDCLKKGWLAFRSAQGTERRRCFPIPVDWEYASVAELERLCREAAVVPDAGARRPRGEGSGAGGAGGAG